MTSIADDNDFYRPAAKLVDLLVAYAGLMLAFAEEGWIPLLSFFAGIFAFFVIDTPARRGIGTVAAAGFGFAAFGAALAEFLNGDVEARVLAGSHLVTYLSVIVLIQQKRRADLYRLVILATLMMALCALLTNSMWLAIALAAYLCGGFLTLSTLLWTRLSVASRNDGDMVEQETSARAVRRLVAPSLRLALISILVGGTAFAFVPRIWSSQLSLFNNTLPPGAEAETGFSERVSLGEIGQVMENNDLVCEIQSRIVASGEPTRFDQLANRIGLAEPLLRGAVMDRYEGGSWQRATTRFRRSLIANPQRADQFGDGLVENSITLQPLGTRILFTPAWLVDLQVKGETVGDRRIDFDAENQVFSRPTDQLLTEEFTYDVYTMLDWQYGSNVRNYVSFERRGRGQEIYEELTSIRGDFGRALEVDLRNYLEAEIPAIVDAPTAVAKSDLVLAHLRDSGKFAYTLNLTRVDPASDPVIDFLKNGQKGHCEYFASSMALLLRSLDVPTRLINGFKGGAFNEEEGVFEIRQLHAHAWLEVYDDQTNQWLTYDPTPGARDTAVAARQQSVVGKSGSLWNGIEQFWRQGMFLTRQQQQRQIYGPLADATRDGWALLSGVGNELNSTQTRRGKITIAAGATLLFVAAGFALLLASSWKRKKSRNTRRKHAAKSDRDDATAHVLTVWYDRYLALVERVLGQTRVASQTQQEFSDVVAALSSDSNVADAGNAEQGNAEQSEAVAVRSVQASVADLAPSVTHLFYQSRFGKRPMSSAELQALNDRLQQLEGEVVTSAKTS